MKTYLVPITMIVTSIIGFLYASEWLTILFSIIQTDSP
jgi:uncharacterized BrkB/YihY/UPF0761 family membrane protein